MPLTRSACDGVRAVATRSRFLPARIRLVGSSSVHPEVLNQLGNAIHHSYAYGRRKACGTQSDTVDFGTVAAPFGQRPVVLSVRVDPNVTLMEFFDPLGNRRTRLVAPPGPLRL